MKYLVQRIRAFRHEETGVAATEFALIAPVFALSLVGMIDLGIAVQDRIELNRVIRAGAQVAMAGEDTLSALESAVVNATVGPSENGDPPTAASVDYDLSISRTCECGGVAGLCSARCDDGAAPSLFYNFIASKSTEPIMLPDFSIQAQISVQVR